MKSRYDKFTYAAFIDSYYENNQLRIRNVDYETYLTEMDQLEAAQDREIDNDKKEWGSTIVTDPIL